MKQSLIFFVVFQLLILTGPLKSAGSDDHSCRTCCVSMCCLCTCLMFCCPESDESIVQAYDRQQRLAYDARKREIARLQAHVQGAEQCFNNALRRDKDAKSIQ